MKNNQVKTISAGDDRFSPKIHERFQALGVEEIKGIGNEALLFQNTLGILCSVRCPGSIILKTYDFVKKYRDTETVFVSGFHSPMERECLNILSRGRGKAVWCVPRGIERFRLPKAFETSIQEGRLVVTSVFHSTIRRPTQESSMRRNMFVAAISDEILLPFVSDQGKLFSFISNLIGNGHLVKTFNDRNCEHLIRKGVLPL